MKKFNVAVVGATGMVGGKFLEVLTERQLPVDNYYLFASAKSAGKKIDFMGKEHTVIELTKENVTALKGKVDFALFSAGAGVSKEFAPIFAEIGAIVVDNSSQWRMHDDVPPCRARGQPRGREVESRHNRKPQLLHDSGSRCAQTSIRQVRHQAHSVLYLSGSVGRGRCRLQRPKRRNQRRSSEEISSSDSF